MIKTSTKPGFAGLFCCVDLLCAAAAIVARPYFYPIQFYRTRNISLIAGKRVQRVTGEAALDIVATR
jgi:hypothetical protein